MMDLKGVMPESWCCVDCGINTAPGFKNRAQAEQAFAVDLEQSRLHAESQRVHRGLHHQGKGLAGRGHGSDGRLPVHRLPRSGSDGSWWPRNFVRKHPFNSLPGTARLLSRRGAAFGGLCWAGRRRAAHHYSAAIIYDNDLQASDSDGVDCDDSCDADTTTVRPRAMTATTQARRTAAMINRLLHGLCCCAAMLGVLAIDGTLSANLFHAIGEPTADLSLHRRVAGAWPVPAAAPDRRIDDADAAKSRSKPGH